MRLFLFLIAFVFFFRGNAVTVQAYNLRMTKISCNSITVKWSRGNGNLCMVVCRQLGAARQDPVDSIGYSASRFYGSGADLGSGNYCVYAGSDSFVDVTGLSENASYIFQVYELDYNPFIYMTSQSPSDTGKTAVLQSEITSLVINPCHKRNLVQFKAKVTADFAISGFQWQVAGTLITGDSFTIHLPNDGLNTVKLRTLPSMGCAQEMVETKVFIYPGLIQGSIQKPDPLCSDQLQTLSSVLKFGIVAGTSFTRKWILNDSEFYNTVEVRKNFKPATTQKLLLVTYTHFQLNYTGCSDTLTDSIRIIQSPVFHLGKDTCLRQGEKLLLRAPVKGNSFTWNGVLGADSFMVTDTGIAILTITDSTGCGYTDSIAFTLCNSGAVRDLEIAEYPSIGVSEGKMHLKNNGHLPLNISIRCMDGRLVCAITLEGLETRTMDLKPGVYIVQVNHYPGIKYLIH